MRIFNHIEQLIAYGLNHALLESDDIYVVRNSLWKFINVEADLDEIEILCAPPKDIYELLNQLTEDAKSLGRSLEFLFEIEIFQAELMSIIMPRNSEVNHKFNHLHNQSPKRATRYFYDLSNASTYIRMDRVCKNVNWKSPSEYGELDITINLSKPEKDPKEIALSKHVKASKYPKCLLCAENAGYQGNVNHPARQNHRIVKMTLAGEPWYLQYSPYVYYNEHAIVLCEEHRNMKIERATFVRLCDFVDAIPHYFIGSNADLHTVGGSILTHDHYQAGNYEMPMMRAKTLHVYQPIKYPKVQIEVSNWPLSVLKVKGKNREEIIELSDLILNSWIDYSDEAVDLIAHTDERHNTITPILRKNEGYYEMYLALRNNRKTKAHPDGLFHPHREHHHIKRENIGLIEVMGLAVLPSRLVEEMNLIKASIGADGILDLEACAQHEALEKHMDWICEIKEGINAEGAELFLKDQIGKKFEAVLKDAGIYKSESERMLLFLKEGCLL